MSASYLQRAGSTSPGNTYKLAQLDRERSRVLTTVSSSDQSFFFFSRLQARKVSKRREKKNEGSSLLPSERRGAEGPRRAARSLGQLIPVTAAPVE